MPRGAAPWNPGMGAFFKKPPAPPKLLMAENGVFGKNGRLSAFIFLFIIPYPPLKCKRLFGNWCKYFMNGEKTNKQDTPLPLHD